MGRALPQGLSGVRRAPRALAPVSPLGDRPRPEPGAELLWPVPPGAQHAVVVPRPSPWCNSSAVSKPVGRRDATRRYQYVPLAQIADHLAHAVVAAEDARFFTHGGIDWQELAQARCARSSTSARCGGFHADTAAGQEPVSHHASGVPPQGPGVHTDALRRAGTRQAAHSGALPECGRVGAGVYGAEAAARYYYQTSAAALTRERRPPRGGAAGAPHPHAPAYGRGKRPHSDADATDGLVRRDTTAPASRAASCLPMIAPGAAPHRMVHGAQRQRHKRYDREDGARTIPDDTGRLAVLVRCPRHAACQHAGVLHVSGRCYVAGSAHRASTMEPYTHSYGNFTLCTSAGRRRVCEDFA